MNPRVFAVLALCFAADIHAQSAFLRDPAIRYSNLFGGEIAMDALFAPDLIADCGGDFCRLFEDGEAVCDDEEFHCLNLGELHVSVPRDFEQYVEEAQRPENVSTGATWERDGMRHHLILVGERPQRSMFAHHLESLDILGMQVPVYSIVTTNLYAEPREWAEKSRVLYSPEYGVVALRATSQATGESRSEGTPFFVVGRCGYLATHPDCAAQARAQ
jgi:hypothetical protein